MRSGQSARKNRRRNGTWGRQDAQSPHWLDVQHQNVKLREVKPLFPTKRERRGLNSSKNNGIKKGSTGLKLTLRLRR